MRALVVLASLAGVLLGRGVAHAQEAAASKDADWVAYPSGSDEVRGFLALPKSPKDKKSPGVVVIQEWWGVNDWIKEQARALAKEGYVALAPDLYRGRVAAERDEAHELMRGLPEDRALRDLDAVVRYLKSRPDVNGESIACIGWCMGGGYSLKLALASPDVKACVINYGALATDEAKLAKLHAAVLGSFGSADRGIPTDDVKTFEATLKKLGKPVDVKIYEGAGHGFQNPNNKAGYKPDAAKDAWTRTLDFLKKTLNAS